MSLQIAVLALQGAFIEHEQMFRSCGAECFELRQKTDLRRHFDALVLPGGESTAQSKLLRELDMFDELAARIRAGMPVFATCAGIILLAEKIADSEVHHFGGLPITVKRNAYGRQLSSFWAEEYFSGVGVVSMPFIRAPQIESAAPAVEILAFHGGYPVAVRYGNMLAMTFHPEITGDKRIHQWFTNNICAGNL